MPYLNAQPIPKIRSSVPNHPSDMLICSIVLATPREPVDRDAVSPLTIHITLTDPAAPVNSPFQPPADFFKTKIAKLTKIF